MMTAPRLESTRRLSELLAGIAPLDTARDRPIGGLALDSRRVRPGDLFFACPGTRQHGVAFVDDALARGAAAIALDAAPGGAGLVWQRLHAGEIGVPVIAIPELAQVIGPIAERFYGSPSAKMTVVGVTGTNGKTSCSQFIAQALNADAPCGVIGTLGNGLVGKLAEASHTTPDAVALHALLAELHAAGAQGVAMEVSSHGLHQGRVNGVAFDAALFTNLSRDHLDYHGDMRAYGEAKARLFDMPGLQHAVINADDAYGRRLLRTVPAGVNVLAYGFGAPGAAVYGGPMVQGLDLELTPRGLRMRVLTPWGEGTLRSALLGRFNAVNLLGVLAVLLALDCPLYEALARIGRLKPVPGRMERFGGSGLPVVVVDYAHTPDALEQVLGALREQCRGQLWCVFGCGGERDRGKRALMGQAALGHADRIVLTDDNPRGEDGAQIISDIRIGLPLDAPVRVIRDRAEAIAHAIAAAGADDMVLVAGKGHEDYQLVGAERRAFSDTAQVRKQLQRRRTEGAS